MHHGAGMSATLVEQPRATPRRPVTPWWPAAFVVAAGLLVGIGTQHAQGVLPDRWGVLANSGVAWALCALGVGSALPTPRWSALGGAAHLVLASVVYYASVGWLESGGSGTRGAVVWSLAGVVAGPVFGLAGHWFARRPDRRAPVLALVGGVLAGEGMHLVRFAGNPDLRGAGLVELSLTAVLAMSALVRSSRRTSPASTALVVAVVIGAATATLLATRAIDTVLAAW
jgi:hypothetical protein